MKIAKLKNTEYIILAILWISLLTTYLIALFNGYNLFVSNYIGLFALTVATVFSLLKPKLVFESILFLLIIGLFNLASYLYFFNIVMTFGFSGIVTPGIQLFSLILLCVLVFRERDKSKAIYKKLFRQTNEDKLQSKIISQNHFKLKFEKLSDKEIENKLKQDLVPEAIFALKQIREERKS